MRRKDNIVVVHMAVVPTESMPTVKPPGRHRLNASDFGERDPSNGAMSGLHLAVDLPHTRYIYNYMFLPGSPGATMGVM